MARIIFGVIVGFIVWSIVWVGSEQTLAALWPAFGEHSRAAERALTNGEALNSSDDGAVSRRDGGARAALWRRRAVLAERHFLIAGWRATHSSDVLVVRVEFRTATLTNRARIECRIRGSDPRRRDALAAS